MSEPEITGHLTDPRWMPVNKWLPDIDQFVLAWEPASAPLKVTVARYAGPPKRVMQTAWVDPWGEWIDVSHWMPLPNAPEGEDRNG
jgi:hypothetical protein